MDIWTVVRTVLEKNPSIKAKELIAKVREKTDLSKSTIYDQLASLELQGKFYRDKGRYWLEKPRKIQEVSSKMLGLWDYLKWKTEHDEEKGQELGEITAKKWHKLFNHT